MKTLCDVLDMFIACVNPMKNCEGCKDAKRCDFYFSVIWSSVLDYYLPRGESYIKQ